MSDIGNDADGLPVPTGIAGPLLAGKTVVLTGAAGGIGRRVSEVLCEAGANAVLLDRPGDSLSELEDRLRATTAEVRATDVTSREAVAEVVRDIEARLGSIDVLVNCAGLWKVQEWDDIDDNSWRTVLDVNLGSTFICCQAVLPGMVDRGTGSIVNFSSTAGEYGSISPAAHYAAAKAGVIGLTKSLAREVSPSGVRVNAISPGPTDTVALVGTVSDEAKAKVGARTLLGRLADTDEIANGVLYLASPMSSFVTGHVLRVNGGSLL
jgi:NAD(P)-dependent dehydrogenase (short-subunit alcohol dehydrogenase family)